MLILMSIQIFTIFMCVVTLAHLSYVLWVECSDMFEACMASIITILFLGMYIALIASMYATIGVITIGSSI